MLSQAARQLVEARSKGGLKAVRNFSFRAFIGDLVPLLSESMMGHAATACFVCLSQAPDNIPQSKYALELGEVFAKLCWTQPRQVPPIARGKIEKEAAALLQEASKVLSTPSGGGKMRGMRVAQKRDCEQRLALMEHLR